MVLSFVPFFSIVRLIPIFLVRSTEVIVVAHARRFVFYTRRLDAFRFFADQKAVATLVFGFLLTVVRLSFA